MKKTISLILCFAMLLSTVAFSLPALALELDFGVEEVGELAQETPQEDVILLGTEGSEEGKPGINIITGTIASYGFEDPNYDHSVAAYRDDGVWTDPDNSNNRVLKISDVQHSNVGITPIPVTVADRHSAGYKYPLLEGKTFESTRPFTVSFKVKGTKANQYIILRSGIANTPHGINPWKQIAVSTTGAANTWVNRTMRITYADATHCTGTFVLCFYNDTGASRGNAYFDDISIVPDYRVVFYAPDGVTVVKSEYVNGSATTYTIPQEVYDLYASDPKFLGFKLVGTADEDIVEGTIDLANEDLEFVAVTRVDVIAPAYVSAIEGTKATLSAKYVADWSVDDESLVTLVSEGSSATIITKGYAGTVNVTATSVEDPTITETVAIKLHGPSKAKPGFNIITGSNEAYDFQDPAFDHSILYPRTEGIASDPDNANNRVMWVGSEMNSNISVTPVLKTELNNAIGHKYPLINGDAFEASRPLTMTYKLKGTSANQIVILMSGLGNAGSAGTNWFEIGRGTGGNAQWTTITNKFTYAKATSNTLGTFLLCFRNTGGIKSGNKVYIDDISIVPDYKVTYLDENGLEMAYEYVDASKATYTVNDSMVSILDSSKFDGYKIFGTDETVTEITLANEDIVLVPSAKEGVEVPDLVTLTFVAQDIKNAPVVGMKYVVAGTELNMADYYYGVSSIVTGKHFNGWSTTGSTADLVYSNEKFVVNENTTFYPVVNYDFNFETTDGQKGWLFPGFGTIVFEDGFMKTRRRVGATSDQFIRIDKADIPAADVYKLIFWVAQDYTSYSDTSHTSSAMAQFNIGNRIEGLYYTQPNVGVGESRKVAAYVRQIVEGPDGKKYAGIEVNLGDHALVDKQANFLMLRFDTDKYDIDYRYLQVVTYEYDKISVDLKAPEAGEVAVDAVIKNSVMGISNFEWIGELSDYGRFKADSDYKAKFDISSKDSKVSIAEEFSVFVDGAESVKVLGFDSSAGVISVEVTFKKTGAYKAFDFNIDDVPTEIFVEDFDYATQFTANITETSDGVLEDIIWEIVDGNAARLTSDGVFEVECGGTVTVKAVSAYNEYKTYTKEITITLKEDFTTSTITFEGDLAEVPAPRTKIVGSTLDMDEYLLLEPAVSGKIINGWVIKGGNGEVIVSDFIVPDEDIVLCAVVNYNVDMAVANNIAGWKYNVGTVSHDAEKNMLVASYNYGTSTSSDVILEKSGFAIPADDVYAIAIDFDPNYTTDGQVYLPMEIGRTMEGIFYKRTTDSGTSADRQLMGKVVEYTEDGYARALFPTVSNSSKASGKNWNGTVEGIRFDFGAGYFSYGIRRILVLERTAYEENYVELTGIVEPETAKIIDTTSGSDKSGLAEIKSIEWTCDDGFMEYTYDGEEYVRFDGGKEYTVVITAIPADISKVFTEDTTVTINGKEAEVVVANNGNLLEITYTFTATESLKDFVIAIDGPATISKAGRTTQYKTVSNVEIPVVTAYWSVEAATKDEYEAAFEGASYSDYVFDPKCVVVSKDNGQITPIYDGVFALVATSHYNPAVTARLVVELKKQDDKITVTYDKNTDAEVTVPAPIVAGGRIELSTEILERDGYMFAGWSTSPESREVVDVVAANGEDITVYAVWDKIHYGVEFNGSLDGMTQNINCATGTLHDSYLEVKSNVNSYDVRMFHQGGLRINPKRVSRAIVRQSLDKVGNYGALIYYWIPGQGDILGNGTPGAEFKPITSGVNQSRVVFGSYNGLEEWQNIVLTFDNDPDWAASEYIHNFAYDPFEISDTTCYIDYIRFIDDYRDITFNTNAGGDAVSGMPKDLYIAVGESYTVKELPRREGYTFLGWSKTADGTEFGRTFYVGDDLDLYAVWAKTVETENNGKTAEIVVEGTLAEDFVVVTTESGAKVTVTVELAQGADPIELVVLADDNGIAKIELPDVAGVEFIEIESASSMKEVVLTDGVTADAIVDATEKANAPKEDPKPETSGTSDTKYNYNTTVTDVKPTTDAYETEDSFGGVGESDGEVSANDLEGLMASEGEILINFDKDFEKEFFPASALRQFTSKGMSDSVVTFENKGLAVGSMDNPALFTANFALNAATHPYIVMKIKNTSDSTCKIYFRSSNTGFSETKAIIKDIKSEYTMVVYDMSVLSDWKDTITGMFFAMDATAGDLVEIDWIMFTDEVPENMEAIEGTKDLFPVVNKDAMSFSDVTSDDWFYEEVATAYRLGFVQGMNETDYDPFGNVTIAQAITLAVRLNCSYYGKELPEVAEGAEWYINYVKAAKKADIIELDQFDDYNKAALRKEVAQIIQKALPVEYLPAINVFKTLPDVSTKDPAYGAIRKLYNAGVVVGMDEAFNFYPETNVTRAEIAAIVNRMAVPTNRKRVVTEEELAKKRTTYDAGTIAGNATLGNCYDSKPTFKNNLATATGKTNDPIVYLTNVVGQLDGKELTKITVGLKTEGLAKPMIFFTTPTGGWAATRLISGKAGATDENGVTAYTFDTKSNSQFADTITGLRFDPFDAKDIEFSIAYVIVE